MNNIFYIHWHHWYLEKSSESDLSWKRNWLELGCSKSQNYVINAPPLVCRTVYLSTLTDIIRKDTMKRINFNLDWRVTECFHFHRKQVCMVSSFICYINHVLCTTLWKICKRKNDRSLWHSLAIIKKKVGFKISERK